ncbi:nitrite reductase large subunit NirB [Paenibacillus sp. YPG26]|uniref:nitrite reductase large subunit NirB n=1 Tax=Paenibacillus sp. YPG26 TaxID=2878915 RepID=UPI00203D2B82|nr:nitrite reductase large subunit NirB [Paenibacillus sp. YPG26]USB31778.1 nitrite reductase large subunit NirB [Paenibacillus sp. YPG26]
MTKRLVMIGNGMAGVRCIEEILKLAPNEFEITVFGSEPYPNYNRILLSKVLQGDSGIQEIILHDWDWYAKHGIQLYAGEKITCIDPEKMTVLSDSGRIRRYDVLILATGSLPFMLPLPGADMPGVMAFRNITDCLQIIESARTYRKAAVIGGGLLGLEAARGLLNQGMRVEVVHNSPFLMNRQLDRTAARMLQEKLEVQGMSFLLDKNTTRVTGRRRASGLRFSDGSHISADLVIMAVGIQPNVELASRSNILVNRGIIVNDFMETSIPNIYAVGECAEHRGISYGLVAPLYEQGKVLARTVCGIQTAPYQGSILFSQLKVAGAKVFSAGQIHEENAEQSIISYDGQRGTYKKIVISPTGNIAGAVLFGDVREGTSLLELIRRNADVSALYKADSHGEVSSQSNLQIAEMSDHETVCSCNGVSKSRIMNAIREEGLETVEQIRDCTRAAGTCGGCTPRVAALLKYTLTNMETGAQNVEAICGCTTYSHDMVKEAVSCHRYEDEYQLMTSLGWTQPMGCLICRPALHYYLGSQNSYLFNTEHPLKRSGALRRSDGTYTVVPRIPGGSLSDKGLMLLNEMVRNYEIPYLRLTNGGIELPGILESNIDSLIHHLGVEVMEYQYGYPLPPITTCTDPGWQIDAFHDPVSLAVKLEMSFGNRQMPSPLYIAVSGSPRHSAGTLTKDLGFAAAPAGWEVYVGGSSQPPLVQGQLLSVEAGEEEAVKLATAFLQWYQESAWYMEPSWKWLQRMGGIIKLREELFDEQVRDDLAGRWSKQPVTEHADPYTLVIHEK